MDHERGSTLGQDSCGDGALGDGEGGGFGDTVRGNGEGDGKSGPRHPAVRPAEDYLSHETDGDGPWGLEDEG